MAGTRIGDHPRRTIDHSVGRGDERPFELALEYAIHRLEHTARLSGVLRLGGYGNLQHRRDERRRHAVARHVGHENSKARGVELMELVEVARHRGHRHVADGDGQSRHARQFAWEDRSLDLLRHVELGGEDGEPALGIEHA